MTTLTTVRASSLPLAFECAASLGTPEIRINPISEPANEGSAGHEIMRQIAESDAKSLDGIDLLAIGNRFGVDPDDLRPMAFNGLWIWKEIRDSFRDASGELELQADIGGVKLTGHIDLFAHNRRIVNIADWKFGRVDRDYSEQVRGYMALVLLTHTDVDIVQSMVCWMRERETEPYSMARSQLGEWLARFTEVVNGLDLFRPGPGCWKCPRAQSCPAHVADARHDVAVLVGPDLAERIANGLADLPPAEIVSLHRRAKQIAKICESLDHAVKLHVDQAGGSLPDGAGAELRFIEINRRELNPQKAWPVVQAKLSDDELAGCLKISASKLDDAIATKAGRGQGAAAKRRLAEELEAAQAITLVPSRQLRDARVK